MIGDLSLVSDVLVPLGLLLAVVTTVGTVHWLKGKRRLALLAPLSVVSVIGVIGITRVAKPDSPWARYRYGATRLAQARARFGGRDVPPAPRREPTAAAALTVTLTGVVAGVPLGAVTSLVGGVLIAHALLAAAGRPTSRRVCAGTVGVAAAGEVVVAAAGPVPALPGVAATLVTAAGVALLYVPSRTG